MVSIPFAGYGVRVGTSGLVLIVAAIVGMFAFGLSALWWRADFPISSIGNYGVFALFVGYFLSRRSGSFDVARLFCLIAIATAVSYLVFGSEDSRSSTISDLWKFSIGVPVTFGLVAAVVTSKWAKYSIAAMVFAAVLSLALNFRSLALVCLAAAALSFFFSKARSRTAGVRALAAALTISIIAIVLPRLMTAGVFGEEVRVRTARQLSSGAGLLLGGRTEPPLSFAAIARHPWAGWGSTQNIDRDTVGAGQAIARSLGMVDPGSYLNYWIRPDGRISLHSILLGSWAEGGIVAAVLPLLLIVLFAWGAVRSRGRLAPLAILLSVQGVWDLLFSPWSDNRSVLIAGSAALVILVLRHSAALSSSGGASSRKLEGAS
ncbi:hypothetical protein QP735_14185 [Curtobacterium citreum]|uniref:hypothetical protein n=1 Tax=Curtobacterium citreum TaxID=2036 RepID=UPI0025508974|nr:hypothetical protein [Curtobacterium citreum]MDK8173675.1 hypothetical protein [Curtobacterium citreum]